MFGDAFWSRVDRVVGAEFIVVSCGRIVVLAFVVEVVVIAVVVFWAILDSGDSLDYVSDVPGDVLLAVVIAIVCT